MATLIPGSQPAAEGGPDHYLADDLRGKVWSALGAMRPRPGRLQRRSRRRYPYPYLVYLTPVADDGVTPQGESVVVVGKHLSEGGLGFYHPEPLPHRRMIASLETTGGKWIDLLIDISWCRFTREGWYESGGRFLQAAPTPEESSG